MTTRRVLVIAANAGDGDAGAGHEVLRRLREAGVAERWWLSLIGDSQFQIEHAMDLQINDLAIFVDSSGADGTTPGSASATHGDAQTNGQACTLRHVSRPTGYRISTSREALSPSDVLHALSTLSRRESLPSCFELTLNLSPEEATAADDSGVVDEALALLTTLLDNPDPEFWQTLSRP